MPCLWTLPTPVAYETFYIVTANKQNKTMLQLVNKTYANIVLEYNHICT